MTWDEYYEKANDWAVSTSVKKMSQLENIGPSSEITDLINLIGYENRKGATRLLNIAVERGVKFSGEELVDIWDCCDKESINIAIDFSADKFTRDDLDDLALCMDEEQIIVLAKKYKITLPKDIFDETVEELCYETTTSVSWSHFYETYIEWDREYAINCANRLTEYGDEDEVMEVLQELYGDDKCGASKFIWKAIAFGVKFSTSNLNELVYLCDAETVKTAVLSSCESFTYDDLEELYGNVDDSVIKEVARKRQLRFPGGIQECNDATYKTNDIVGFWKRLFGKKCSNQIFSEEECFMYGIHPDDEMFRKTMELDILSKNYKK